MAFSQMSNYSNRQKQPMHARPICSCLAPARSSGKFCHFPLFSKQLQEAPRAHSANSSEDRDLGKTATPKPFCPFSFQSSCQVSFAGGSRDRKLQVCVIALCSSSVGRMPSELASFKARQQGIQPHVGQTGHHAGVK